MRRLYVVSIEWSRFTNYVKSAVLVHELKKFSFCFPGIIEKTVTQGAGENFSVLGKLKFI